ncbi:xylulokinase [Paraferrimonas sedimenticola]|uniref:Xylulose kinase n=1 Tax=Paraferrimonas sedimenticola TaxID=375674 RepID=A0AA37RV92_9GAMM|nr:xylulokinase [Paraferrimonas sedimenticola]GLP95910.1 xylulokinase [Paraferrimonas sedimenticola]
MYIGIDLGTSGVKVLVLDDQDQVVASQSEPLSVSRPQPLWSEQDPADWWQATCTALDKLKLAGALTQIKAIGLSGQMHGATLLDNQGQVLRPAILWNDGRCQAECQAIEAAVPNSREIGGNIVMPGFTAPKLLWVKNHEPEIFDQVAMVLLPKDYLRYRLSGDYASDMSDSAGTLWLDVAKRSWSPELLAATGLSQSQMPKLFEGSEITGHLSESLAQRWGLECVPIVAGGGDNAAGAVGVGITEPGQAMLSLGTSGVYFVASDGFRSNPDSALHSFCHALPNSWHMMSVVLSAAACLEWWAKVNGLPVVALLEELAEHSDDCQQDSLYFLPYLSGERTPHNDPHAMGHFIGLNHQTNRAMMTHAVLEGVGYALADGADALHQTGVVPEQVSLIGGGGQSPYWRQLLANIFNLQLVFRQGGEMGPAFGAARLARLAIETELSVREVCPVPPIVATHQPQPNQVNRHAQRRQRFGELYRVLKPLFSQENS